MEKALRWTCDASGDLDADHDSVLDAKGCRHDIFQHLDMICLADAGRQCAHDPGTSLISTYPHNAGATMRGFPRQNISTVACTVEGWTQSCQVEDVAAGLFGDHSGDLRIDGSCPSPDRIPGMRAGTISRIHCGGDTALRPSRGCTFTLLGEVASDLLGAPRWHSGCICMF